MATRVDRYGVRAHGSAEHRRETVSDPRMLVQLRLGHQLKNAIVAAWRAYEESKKAVWSGFAEVSAAEGQLAAAEERAIELTRQARAEHSADRTAATRQSTADQLAAARAAVGAARQQRKQAMHEVSGEARPKLAACEEDYERAIRDLYRVYCQDGIYPMFCGACDGVVNATTGTCVDCETPYRRRKLYWATYNAIVEDMKTAVKLVEQKRAQGRPAQLRFRRWQGEGTLSAQLQRQHGPACRCLDCATKTLNPWRITKDGVWLVVARRVSTEKAAVSALARIAGVPAEVLGLADVRGRAGESHRQAVAAEPPAPRGRTTARAERARAEQAQQAAAAADTLQPWRVVTAGAAMTVCRRAANLAAAVDLLAAAVGLPAAALAPVELDKPIKGQTVWRVELVDPAHLIGLPGPSDPTRSPQLLASGEGKWRNVFGLGTWIPPEQWQAKTRAERRREGRSTAAWQLGEGEVLQVPVQLHRMLPAEADVPMAQLTRRHIASQPEMSLAVTARLPDPDPVCGRPPIALHAGWRQREDGSLRVATWACPEVVAVPANVRDVVVEHGGRWGEIIMPARWLAQAEHPPALLSQRDNAMAPMLDELAGWLDEHPDACDERLTGPLVRRWQSQSRLAALTLRWREQPPPDARELLARLEQWRRQDKALWETEAHLRSKLTGRRDDAWRRVAAWLATAAGTLVVDKTNLADVRSRGDAAETDPTLPAETAQTVRARAAQAAPGRLRHLATVTATREGVPVVAVDSAGLSRLHRRCRVQAPADRRFAAAAVVTCATPGCGAYDQDYNATALMLERALQP